LFAVTSQTAAEISISRADSNIANMGLTSWKGNIVRKQDILIAKNYLTEDELDTLNRLVVIFLETAELRAKNRADISMKFWQENVDKILEFNDKPLLKDKGKVSQNVMENKLQEIYQLFDKKRKKQAVVFADQEDLEVLLQFETDIKHKK
jgi:hypothetical protein